MPIKHAKVSAIADNAVDLAAGEIVPTDWNAAHAWPSWWTVNETAGAESVKFGGQVIIAVNDATVDDLLQVTIPATYVDGSNYGRIFRAAYPGALPNEYVYAFGLDKMRFKAAAGEGDAIIQISAEDQANQIFQAGSSGMSLTNASGLKMVDIATDGAGSLALFGATAVGQQTLAAAPTGAQIRAVLVAFGLVAA